MLEMPHERRPTEADLLYLIALLRGAHGQRFVNEGYS